LLLVGLVGCMALRGQVAIVTGASRGIGREVSLALAREGCNVVVAAKSTEESANLPGTIFSVAKEIQALGVKSLAIRCDVRSEEEIEAMVQQTVEKFGRVDILINNAGALWWKKMIDTPIKRYDLINQINARATFIASRAVLPHMLKQKHGHIINMSPPIDLSFIPGKIAYCISKFGMTMVALGLGEEVRGQGVACNALWPATAIESFATINFKMGGPEIWRKAAILADACVMIVKEDPNTFTGQQLIDEDYMRSRGVTDFVKYRCDPNSEPPRIANFTVERGHVTEAKSAAPLARL